MGTNIFAIFIALLMIVNYLYSMRGILLPYEAKPKLIVDPNAVLLRSISPQPFKVIARRVPQVFQALSRRQHF
jgi:hypothetical protein